MDQFAKEKNDSLIKKDKSKKGSIDKDAVALVDLINSFTDFYTTSSCAGRIVLLELKSKKKNESDWLLAKHSKVSAKEILKALNRKTKNVIWFKQQPIILHVACRNMQKALLLLGECRKVFKRSGIISSTSNKTVVEILGSDHLDTIISDKYFVAQDSYIKILVKYANSNFSENKRKTDALFLLLKNSKALKIN